MESNRKRRGFMKGKMMNPLYRAAKPSSAVQYSSKIKPSQSCPSTASVGFLVNQDYAFTPPKQQKVSFILPDNIGQFDNPFGVAADDSIDLKAARYISDVRERFKLERVNSERNKYQEKHFSALSPAS